MRPTTVANLMTPTFKIVLYALCASFALSITPEANAQLLRATSLLPVGSDPRLSPDTLDFGAVVLKDSKTLGSTIKNYGTAISTIIGVGLANNVDFSVQGPNGPYNLDPDSVRAYFVTFSPQTHSAPSGKHVGNLTFTTDQGQKTIYLVGYDHVPLIDTLKFSRNYWGAAGTRIIVTQDLLSSPDSTLDSVWSFHETIRYNKNVLDLINVTNGDLLPSPDWSIVHNILTPGHLNVTAGSSGRALKGKGVLLRLEFHVNNLAKVLDSSYLGVDSSKFSNGFEPIMRVMNGLVRVKDNCNPVFVNSGSASNSIRQNTPNPVTTSTEITYYIGGTEEPSSQVRVRLYNSVGEIVRNLVDAEQPPGTYSIAVDASSLPNGMYTYTYDCGARHEVKHLVVAR